MEPQGHGWGVGNGGWAPRWEGAQSPGCEQGLREPGTTWTPLEDDAGPAKGLPVRTERRQVPPPSRGGQGMGQQV